MPKSRYNRAASLSPYMSQTGAWALSLGTSIGWGSLVITSTTYLSQAGPMGSVLGLIAGALLMLIISRNYHYLMNAVPEAGGAYAFARESFGYDHGFLVAWFLVLTYLAIFWANATSLPLFARYFLGDFFQFGVCYTIFGYEIWLGEALLSVAAILLTACLLIRFRRGAVLLLTGLAILFTIAITICFLAAVFLKNQPFTMPYLPDQRVVSQILISASISPWAFIGFENISHLTEEFSFPRKKSFRILTVSVITTTLLYIFIILLSVTAYPPQFSGWLDYIRHIGELSGLEGLPAFYAAHHYMGQAGVVILMLALLALVITSLIGNTLALSRLFYALGKDRILPEQFAGCSEQGVPAKAVMLTAGISLVIPFLGRTAIGWIVDVTSIGASIIYILVSASAWKMADFRGDRTEKTTGAAGAVIMTALLLYLLLPNLFTDSTMAPESFILFVVWAILGFVYFRNILKRDRARHFGNSIIVWIGLLSLVLFVSLVWLSQNTIHVTETALEQIQGYYREAGVTVEGSRIVSEQLAMIRHANARSIAVVISLFAVSLIVLITNFSLITRRAEESEEMLSMVKEQAGRDPLTGVKSKLAYAEREDLIDGRIAAGEMEAFSVVVCDVNGLKQINDTLGHKAGDAYIQKASSMICELYQHSPVFRVGGDEFVVLLTGRDYENRERIIAELNARVENNVRNGEVVISAGMSDYREAADQKIHQVFERADALMYLRKKELKAKGAPVR
ncbi:MAG: amino acid permease [Eubacterium sp.]|nr:amino acid permease [Eubacterium sp.]